MSTKTNIEWTDATWNPIRGCSRVSEGCRNCYAEKVAYRFSGPGQPYEGLAHRVNGHAAWTGTVELVEKNLLFPLACRPTVVHDASCSFGARRVQGFRHGLCKCPTRPRRIFVNSMSDLFHENVPDEWIDRIFAVMALCPQHTFQILTKRPERMLRYLSDPRVESRVAHACVVDGSPLGDGFFSREGSCDLVEVYWKNCVLFYAENDAEVEAEDDYRWKAADFQWPLPNVWLGVSVEDQKTADERIPLLLETPAAVRFISAEPLLGSVCFHNRLYKDAAQQLCCADCHGVNVSVYAYPDWVICGGESGPGARPMHPDWARSLRDQCVNAGVPFFFKQWGEWGPGKPIVTVKRHPPEMEDVSKDVIQKLGKKAAAAVLDGREWREFPPPPQRGPVAGGPGPEAR